MAEKKKVVVKEVIKPKTRKKPSPKKNTPKKPVIKTKRNKKPRKIGRPTKFTQKLGDIICEQLALGMSMRKVCAPDNIPSMQTVFSWLRTNKEFLEQYTRAKEEAADLLVEDMIEIADDATNDYMEKVVSDGEGGGNVVGYMVNGEFVNRSRLRIETRKWLAMKLKPKKYGDKLAVDQTGEINVNHSYADKTDAELNAMVLDYANKVKKK